MRHMITYWDYMLVIAKGRSCQTGKIPVRFAKEKLTFLMDEEEAKSYAALVSKQRKQNPDYQVDENQAYPCGKGNSRYPKQGKMPY